MPVQSFGMGIGGNPNLSRQSRRLYIGSITQEVNEQNLADFFNAKMMEMNIGTGASGNPVLAVQCNYEKNYAFVEVSQMMFRCGPNPLTVNCSFVVQKMLPLLWLLTASFLSTDHWKYVDRRTMVATQSHLLESMYQVLFRRTSLTLSIRSSLVAFPPTSTKNRLWNYLRVSASLRPLIWFVKMGLELQRCVEAITYRGSSFLCKIYRVLPSLNTLIRQSPM